MTTSGMKTKKRGEWFSIGVLATCVVLSAGRVFGGNTYMQEARPSPTWLTKGVIYQIQPRAFTAEGTLAAAEKKLPYLKEMGITIVYLLPIFTMDKDTNRNFWSPRQIRSGFNNPKNQYRISDYFHVDEEYGTDSDLKRFSATAHKLGMKVLFDLVYLHCGPTAPFLREHPDFTWWNADGTVKEGPWRFPKLNFANPALREYLKTNILYLMTEFGADGFRCDVGDGIPLDFWCEAHDRMDAFKAGNGVLLCEGSCGANQYKGFDADYGWFPCNAVSIPGRKGNARTLRANWEGRDRSNPSGAKFVNHYENHDIATDARPRRELEIGHAAVDQIHVWLFTADGIPLLFNGNEFAEASPTHSMFGKTPLDWAAAQTPAGKTRLELVKSLAAIRHTHPSLTAVNGRKGMTWLDATQPQSVTAFARRGGGETILVVQNWTDHPVETKISLKATSSDLPAVSYLASKSVDASITGTISATPLLSRAAEKTAPATYRLGPYGFVITTVAP